MISHWIRDRAARLRRGRRAVASRFAIALMLLVTPWFSGCEARQGATDAVSVTAVNYTGKELNAVVFIDPVTDKAAGGPGADPYGGSGTMCCFALPRKWRAGIQVQLQYDWWAGKDQPRQYQTLTAEIPPYPTPEPGVLWALFHEDGSIEVFASAVDPGHPQWPGKVKSWPVPSREYKLKLWQMDYDDAARLIPYYKRMIAGLSNEELLESWRHSLQYQPNEVAKFSGPHDPEFAAALSKEGQDSLERALARLRHLERIKP